MDLQTFISETLIQIAAGIEQANASLNNSEAIVNPKNVAVIVQSDRTIYGSIVPPREANMRRAVHAINFDVAVTVAEGTGTRGGIGVVVGAVALGSQGSSNASNSSNSRVQFSVPMALPEGGA